MLRKALYAVGGIGVVGLGGGGYIYQQRLKSNNACTAEDFNARQNQQELQDAFRKIAKRDRDMPEIVFYRYTTCPFCSKVKAFLDFHDLPHTLVEVEPMFKKEIKYNGGYGKVPQLRFNVMGHHGPYLVDSDVIVNSLAPLVGAGAQLTDPKVTEWRAWASGVLVRHLVLNINPTLLDAWRGYDYIDEFATIPYANKLFLKVMGAPIMYAVAKFKTMPALKASGEIKAGDNVRLVLHDRVNRFATEGLQGATEKKPFHGGEKPDLADLDVYGVFQSVRGHKVYDDLLLNTSIGPWMAKMDAATKKAPYAPAK